jgi:hypothetical protein
MATQTTATTQSSSTQATDEGRLIDPRGHRFGAGLSVVVLAAGFVLNLAIVLPFLAVALGASAIFGTRYSILGRPWAPIRSALRLSPPKELEHEYPPRFAQALGTIGFILATILFVVGFTQAAWVIAAAVGGLQLLLAATGYCLGCKLYFLKWYVPAQYQRLARRTTVESTPLNRA